MLPKFGVKLNMALLRKISFSLIKGNLGEAFYEPMVNKKPGNPI